MACYLADLGNTRLKWARLGEDGRPQGTLAAPVDDESAWPKDLSKSEWAIASVNPPVAARLGRFLAEQGVEAVHWYTSASSVPVRHVLETPEKTGADRALAVLAATDRHPPGRPGLVVSCGTAITVERIDAAGVWQGGAIAAGLGPSARALHLLTAQLPLVQPDQAPPAWGRSTEPALAAGLFWGMIGAVRELLTRQAEGLDPKPWLVWTGGDAQALAPWIDWPDSAVVPDLVLEGLARAEALVQRSR